MADINTINVSGTDYSLIDSGAARLGHQHTYASSSHIHYLTAQNSLSGTNLGTANTTYNTDATCYFYAWGRLGMYNISWSQKGSISVPAYGNLSTNIHIYTVTAAKAKPWVNTPLHGRSYLNRYQINTDGKVYLMGLAGRGSAYTQGASLIEWVSGVAILSYTDDAWVQTSGPSATVTGS